MTSFVPSIRLPTKSFSDRAGPAAFGEAWVGAVLSRAGLYTMHHPFEIQGLETTLEVDLHKPDLECATDSHFSKPYPLEIKTLGVTFFNTDSYPFERVLVCSQNSFLRKWPGKDYLVRDFMLVSKETGAIIWIPAMTKVRMGVEVYDSTRNETYKSTSVSRDDLRPLADFVEMVKDA